MSTGFEQDHCKFSFYSCKLSSSQYYFSFGLLLWEMLTRVEPSNTYLSLFNFPISSTEKQIVYQVDPSIQLGSNTSMLHEVAKGFRPVIPYDCPKDYSNLIADCWEHNPLHRPTFQQIYNILEGMKEFTYDPKRKESSSKMTSTYLEIIES